MTMSQIASVVFHPRDENGELLAQYEGEAPTTDPAQDEVTWLMEKHGCSQAVARRLRAENVEIRTLRKTLNDAGVDGDEIDRRAEARRLELMRGRKSV
jgi:hypothetical protein